MSLLTILQNSYTPRRYVPDLSFSNLKAVILPVVASVICLIDRLVLANIERENACHRLLHASVCTDYLLPIRTIRRDKFIHKKSAVLDARLNPHRFHFPFSLSKYEEVVYVHEKALERQPVRTIRTAPACQPQPAPEAKPESSVSSRNQSSTFESESRRVSTPTTFDSGSKRVSTPSSKRRVSIQEKAPEPLKAARVAFNAHETDAPSRATSMESINEQVDASAESSLVTDLEQDLVAAPESPRNLRESKCACTTAVCLCRMMSYIAAL